MPVRWPTYDPIPFERWRTENPELCPEEDCPECHGEGEVEDDCSCPECGHTHTSVHDCGDCRKTGKVEAGGLFAYDEQDTEDHERWRRYCLDTYGRQEVFVFGSNRQGRHGAGAAKRAVEAWGAKNGQAEGRQGYAYAIVTKELRKDAPPVTLMDVAVGVRKFLDYAAKHPDERFLVTRIGGGLAGFDWARQVRPLFDGRTENVVLLEGRRA